MNENRVLSDKEIKLKIRRIAYQIYEANTNEKKIFVIGIWEKGYLLAALITEQLKEISDIEVELKKIELNKDAYSDIRMMSGVNQLENQSVVLIDDVLNTGKTLMYTAKYLLKMPLKQFKTAVLINRNHKIFPIKVDFKGLSLSTSMNECVDVIFSENQISVYLK